MISVETEKILRTMKPSRFVWCQHGQQPGMKIDEHQVCLDRESEHRAKGGTSWGCICKCHR
jgi:hypothetical protein